MNFCNVIEEGDVLVELKYCERCGGLWLRRHASDESYCEGCRAAMAYWILPENPYHSVQRRPANERVRGQGEDALLIGTLLGVADTGGNRARPEAEVVQ